MLFLGPVASGVLSGSQDLGPRPQELEYVHNQVIAGCIRFFGAWEGWKAIGEGEVNLTNRQEKGVFRTLASHSPFPLHFATSWMIGTIKCRFIVYRR